jgi:anti-sigma factor RsiW
MSVFPCQTRTQIRAVIEGNCNRVAFDELEEHLRRCPECQAELQALDDAGDPFLSALQRVLDPTSIQSNPTVKAALARLDALCERAGSPLGGAIERQPAMVAGLDRKSVV